MADMKDRTTYFAHTDHLGSVRLLTKIDQSGYDYFDSLPFGEWIGGGSGTTHKFTGDERDGETGLDHTWFRKYSSQLGRWTTADPAGLMAVSLDAPQSLNRYSYVSNMPLSYFDPTGLWTGPSCGTAEYGCPPSTPSPSPCSFLVLDCWGPSPTPPASCPPFITCPTGGGGGGGGGGTSHTTVGPNKKPQTCVVPTTFQKFGIALQSAVAKFTGAAFGVGAGVNVAGGNRVGVTLAISRQTVVTPNGKAAFVTTFTPISPAGFNSYVSPGVSGYGGFQVSLSNASSPQDLGGPALDFGYGGGRGWGAGGDLSLGWSGSGPVAQGTLTFPLGLGLPAARGHGLAPTFTDVTPICN